MLVQVSAVELVQRKAKQSDVLWGEPWGSLWDEATAQRWVVWAVVWALLTALVKALVWEASLGRARFRIDLFGELWS